MAPTPPNQKEDNAASGTDIITYIGVPLAVLGVLPLLYNSVQTLWFSYYTQRSRRSLVKVLGGRIRTDVINNFIDIDYRSIQLISPKPKERFEAKSPYWVAVWESEETSDDVGLLLGERNGNSNLEHQSTEERMPRSYLDAMPRTWKSLSWVEQPLGRVTRRIPYPYNDHEDDIYPPPAEAEFPALVRYLLDLGAAPEPAGWRALKERGELWAPREEVLMWCAPHCPPCPGEKRATRRTEKAALQIAQRREDSTSNEGNLSLKVIWMKDWTTRGPRSLPLDAVKLSGRHFRVLGTDKRGGNGEKQPEESQVTTKTATRPSDGKIVSSPGTTNSSEEGGGNHGDGDESDIVCRISTSGLIKASLHLSCCSSIEKTWGTCGSDMDIRHLTGNAWFASAATAYAVTTDQICLCDYTISADMFKIASTPVMPCGILVLLGLAKDIEIPQWQPTATAAQHISPSLADNAILSSRTPGAPLQVFSSRSSSPRAMRGSVTGTNVHMQQSQQRLIGVKDDAHRAHEAKRARSRSALTSTRWDATCLARFTTRWLRGRGYNYENDKEVNSGSKEPQTSPRPPQPSRSPSPLTAPPPRHSHYRYETAGVILHRMVRDQEFALSVTESLDKWRGRVVDGVDLIGSDGGVDPVGPWEELNNPDHLESFAAASVLLSIISDMASGSESEAAVLAADIKECLARWKTVRLG